MPEIIQLAGFDLDTTKLQKSLSDLQDTYFDLRKEQKSYADQSKETAKQIDILTKSQKLLEESAGDNTESIEANEKELQDLLKTQKDLYKSEQNLRIQMSTVGKEINQTTTQLKAYQDAEGKTTSLINLGNAALERQITNKNEARAANIALNNVANQLNPNIEEEANLLKQLNSQMDKNTEFIKENSSETAKQKMNVGNYTESVLDALKAMQQEQKELEAVKNELAEVIEQTEKGSEEYKVYMQQINVLNVQINNLGDSINKTTGEVSDLHAGTKLLEGGIGGFIAKAGEAGGASGLLTGAFTAIRAGILGALQAGLAFIATPIGAVIAALAVAVGAVVGAFKLAKASLESTEEGADKLAVVIAAITGVFNGLFKVVKPLGLFFANVFIKTLENVASVAGKVAEGLADVLEFVGAESAAKGVRNFTEEVKNASAASVSLAKAEADLVAQQRQATKIQLDYQKQAEKLRQQRDDETKSISERIAINNQLGNVLQKQSASELAIANKQLKVADLKIKAEGETTEALDQRAEALTNISDIQERITGQESEQLANLNSLRKEAADKQKELDEAAIERALVKSRAEIDLFVANQGFKKKSLEEEYNFNKQLLDKEFNDLQLQYSKKKISAEQFEVQKAQLANEFAQKNAEITIANAQIELDAQIEKNQKILQNSKLTLDERSKLTQQVQNEDLEAQKNFQKILLENGKINQREYNEAINEIDQENRAANEKLKAEQLAFEQNKKLSDLENQKIVNEGNFLALLEIEKQQNALKEAEEIKTAESTGANVQLIKDKYAKYDNELDQQALEFKLKQTADVFGDIASILGENSKAGKAAAIAQATINTYQGVSAAWMAPAVLPQPYDTISKIVASGVALTSGLKAVKQITSTKEPAVKKPDYAGGVIGLRGAGDATSDNVSSNLSVGESVINAKSTGMFANELAAINQAGGGVGINGASNILNQNQIDTNANNSQMAQMIAEAVAVGAEAGTAKGSKNGIKSLSDDRKVMQDAKF